ncbi:MAG: ABC transporter ATP-binding protein [Bacteroidales bacterium]|nr:ABC transporter ATP-binding protein [Bacteroidales bacterium]
MDVVHFTTHQLFCGYKLQNHIVYTPTVPIQLSINKPMLIAILGKNGTGKTTLLKTLAGLHNPISGEIKLNQKNFNKFSTKQKSQWVAYLPAHFTKIPYIRLNEYLLLGKNNFVSKFSSSNENINSVLEKVSLVHKKNTFLTQLSDGEMQRAAIARILIRQCPLMLLDEPLAHLDPKQQFRILELFKEYVTYYNKTIVFSSHLTDMILSFVHKIWLLTDTDFIDKIPEQIIIDRELENNELKIDLPSWKQKNEPYVGCIRIIGDGIAYKYTKYAFHRFGLNTDCNQTTTFSVIIEQTPQYHIRWLLKKEQTVIQEFTNLEQLINFLINKL